MLRQAFAALGGGLARPAGGEVLGAHLQLREYASKAKRARQAAEVAATAASAAEVSRPSSPWRLCFGGQRLHGAFPASLASESLLLIVIMRINNSIPPPSTPGT